MKSLEQINPENPMYQPEYRKWIEDNFTQEKAKCSSQNRALIACIDKNCTTKHPLVCAIKDCSCLKDHKKCSVKSLEFVMEQFKQGKSVGEKICDKLDVCVDEIIDKISAQKQAIQLQIRQGNADHLFANLSSQNKSKIDQELQTKHITGLLMNRALQSVTDSVKSKLEAQIIEQITRDTGFFQQKAVSNFFHTIRSLLLEPSVNLGRSYQLSNYLIIKKYEQGTVACHSTPRYYFAFYPQNQGKIYKMQDKNCQRSTFFNEGRQVLPSIKHLNVSSQTKMARINNFLNVNQGILDFTLMMHQEPHQVTIIQILTIKLNLGFNFRLVMLSKLKSINLNGQLNSETSDPIRHLSQRSNIFQISKKNRIIFVSFSTASVRQRIKLKFSHQLKRHQKNINTMDEEYALP